MKRRSLGITYTGRYDLVMADITALVAKLGWADKHIFHLKELRDDWKEGEEDRIRIENDPHTGNRIYKVIDIPPIPEDTPLVTGDAVHNIRSALDHLAHALMVVAKGSPGPFPYVYFPIAADIEKFKAAKTRIEGARPEAVKAIDGVQPYGGGAGEILWHLHSLDIIDKHQLLIPAASANLRQSMPPSMIGGLRYRFLGMIGRYNDDQLARAFLAPSKGVPFPLKVGDVLGIVPQSQVSEHMYFPLEIAFGEPQVVAGKSLIDTFQRMKDFVRYVITGFNQRGLLDSLP
jgi:hypothetical protein